MYHDCWTFREGSVRWKGLDSRVIWSTVPRPGSSDLSRLQCAWNATQWHLPVVGVSWFAGVRCAGTSVRRDFGTHWRPRLSWRLRCAGTTMHWVHGTLGSTIALASAVRRDFGAPGLRCAGTSVRRDFGAPRRQVQRRAPTGAPVPRTGRNNVRRPPSRFLGQGFSILPRLTAEPPESSIFGGSWIRREPPLSISGRPTRAAARLPAAHPAPCPLGAGILLLTEPPSWVPSTPRRLCGSMLSRAYVDHLEPRRRGNSGSDAIRGAGLLRDDRDRRAAPGRVVENAATRPRDAAANDSRTRHRGRATNSHHLGRRQTAAKPQQARRGDTETGITALGNTLSRLLRAPREPHDERKCQFRIFTCNAPARKPTQLGADGRACGARGGAARLRRPPAAQANVGLVERA